MVFKGSTAFAVSAHQRSGKTSDPACSCPRSSPAGREDPSRGAQDRCLREQFQGGRGRRQQHAARTDRMAQPVRRAMQWPVWSGQRLCALSLHEFLREGGKEEGPAFAGPIRMSESLVMHDIPTRPYPCYESCHVSAIHCFPPGAADPKAQSQNDVQHILDLRLIKERPHTIGF